MPLSLGSNAGSGTTGGNGWSPVLAVVSDGDRRVLQVADWIGGDGTMPATGDYIGSVGLTSLIGEATDLRGATGDAGATGLSATAVLYAEVHPRDNKPPSSNYATLDTTTLNTEVVDVLAFDKTVTEASIFVVPIPPSADLGSGIKVTIWWCSKGTGGTVSWKVSLMRFPSNSAGSSWTTAVATSAANEPSATTIARKDAVTLTTLPTSLAAGDMLFVRIQADLSTGTPSADQCLVLAVIEQVA